MPRGQLLLDSGGHSVKALYLPAHHHPHRSRTSDAATAPAPVVLVVPNCVGAAVHAGTGVLGDQLDRLPHYHGLMVRRPVDRGFIVDGGLQARVWEHVLQRLAIESEEELDVWLTVPFAAPKAVAQLLLLLCTRSFRFGSVTLVSSTFLALIACSFPAKPVSGSNELKADTTSAAHPAPDAAEGGSSSNASGTGRKRRRDEEAGGASTSAFSSADAGVALVVDIGFSGTTAVPYVDFLPVLSSIARLDVGGKLLTNRLKEVLSFSQVNVMEDAWLINHVKERCCAVATDPRRALQHCAALWQGKAREEVEEMLDTEAMRVGAHPHTHDAARPLRYYLPTIPALLPLGVLEAELPARLPRTTAVDTHALQHLLLCQERFLIPELLFTPADVGLEQQGLSQVVTEGVFQRGLLQHVTSLLRPSLLRRVCVYGGTAALPHLRVRLEADVAAAAAASNFHAGEPCTDAAPLRLAGTPPLPTLLQPIDGSSAASEDALQPLIGAWRLFTADANDASTSASELVRLRALVQQRSTVELQHPPAGRVTVETFQLALQCIL